MKERRTRDFSEGVVPVGSITVDVPGLSEEHFDHEGNIVHQAMRKKFEEVLHRTGKDGDRQLADWHWLKDKIHNDERSAVFVVKASAVVIFVAGAGFEFGVRHAKDFRNVLKLVRKENKQD